MAAIALATSLTMTSAPKIKIQNIEPQNWYTGMRDATLQILLTGPGLRDADVTTSYPGARIDSLVRLDSPNYLFVYLNLEGAKAGDMPLTISLGKKRETISYPLREREMPGYARKGFTNADVLYMLMPDRFAQGRADNSKHKTRHPYTINRTAPSLRHGGDLEGLRQHLDYLADLGVTALWLTPVLENDMEEGNGQSSYHGYATTDYYRVDPRFGTNADYRRLVEDAHSKGLKVVMDMIFNHCGDKHPWMADSPSKDWFNNPGYGLQTSYKLTPVIDPYASDVDMAETVDGWFVKSMPDLNQRNPHLMQYLIQNSIWWIETVGIDGIRMDTYPYADARGMARWMKRINDEYPNYNVVGESWVTEPGFTASLQKDCRLNDENTYLNTVMDFALFDRLSQARDEETDDWWRGMNRVYNVLVYDKLYANPANVLAFLDNHDTDRFLGDGHDTLALKQSLALLLTVRRIPQLYYGTEILMNGTKAVTDGNVRKDFPGGFPGDKRNCFTAEGRTRAENAMFSWLRRVLHWRQNNDVIIKGTQKQFIPYQGIYVMHHEYEGRHAMVIINGRRTASTVDLARYKECIPSAAKARDITTGRTYNISAATQLSLTPRQTMILEY